MFITTFTHFLDEKGNIPKTMPKEARELASFMALVVDEATKEYPEKVCCTDIRCINPNCNSSIITEFIENDEKIYWGCGDCENAGIISEWQGSRWDNINGEKDK